MMSFIFADAHVRKDFPSSRRALIQLDPLTILFNNREMETRALWDGGTTPQHGIFAEDCLDIRSPRDILRVGK